MELLHERLKEPGLLAGTLLDWMVQSLDYLTYFQDYYGKGEHAEEKKYAVLNFIRYVTNSASTPLNLLEHLAKLDTTQGKPDEELIVFTTIFRTKGLEYDYVVLPQCDDNLLPYLKGERSDIYDTGGIVEMLELSSKLESERRLFYVALTRARKGVLIGVTPTPSRFLEEIRAADTDIVMRAVRQLACRGKRCAPALARAATQRRYQSILVLQPGIRLSAGSGTWRKSLSSFSKNMPRLASM